MELLSVLTRSPYPLLYSLHTGEFSQLAANNDCIRIPTRRISSSVKRELVEEGPEGT